MENVFRSKRRIFAIVIPLFGFLVFMYWQDSASLTVRIPGTLSARERSTVEPERIFAISHSGFKMAEV